MATVRYIVHDVDAALAFYCGQLGFREVMHPAPAFAMVVRGDLRLTLSVPGGGPGGGQAMPDGTLPAPGGWNRISLEVADLEADVARLRSAGWCSATTSSPASAENRSWSTTRRGTRSSLFEPLIPEAREAAATDRR